VHTRQGDEIAHGPKQLTRSVTIPGSRDYRCAAAGLRDCPGVTVPPAVAQT